MTITYPLTFPADDVGLSAFKLELRTAVARTESPFSYAEKVVKYSGEIWQIEASIPACGRATAEIYNAFLFALKGKYGTFLIGDPNATSPRGSVAGTPLVKGAHTLGDNTILLDGFTPSATGVLLKGDYIQFGTGSNARLYKSLGDYNADGSGEITVDIVPNLRVALTDNQAVITSNTVGLFRLASNVSAIDISRGSLYNSTFRAMEALNGS